MLRFYGAEPPGQIQALRVGGRCPHCKEGSRFSLSLPDSGPIQTLGAKELVANYTCELCLHAIPIRWSIQSWSGQVPIVERPEVVLPVVEEFEFQHVPGTVMREINEALACLSVHAFNGFAALCRRAVQSICSDLGVEGSTRVERQIQEMVELTGLDEGGRELARQIMLTGHDGAHPHLPEVNAARAAVLLSLLQDLTYQLYTRPGKIREAAALRQRAIEGQ